MTNTVWTPSQEIIEKANLTQSMRELNFSDFKKFHQWSTENFQEFWRYVIQKLKIVFQTTPADICDLSAGIESPCWFPQAKMNIAESCFTAPSEYTALIFQQNNQIQTMSYGELEKLTNQIANSLIAVGCQPGDAIAIIMPMTEKAVACYLAIIKMGGVIVSIADSFSASEIQTRLHIAKAQFVICQDVILRGEKQYPLYEKIKETEVNKIVVILHENTDCVLRSQDVSWEKFLKPTTFFSSYIAGPMDSCNIIFSSGTTGIPKAIPWNHTTPIKAASDAFFHHDIHPKDILSWPTNLGWMMGPWLIFAGLINQAAIALYNDSPKERAFGEFIQNTKVTMLGVVPTLVANWRETQCMENLDWSSIKCFSSTGECSNADDMAYLMALAGGKPIIEYCGGTEVGGAYLTSTLIEKNYPSLFSTPALGLNFILLNEKGQPSNSGEVALIPPSIGFSVSLLNADHHQVYYADMPRTADGKILRRHGDQAARLSNNYYSVQGRIDDTMNLGGIKISSAEIERTLTGIPSISETAAVAVSAQEGGPSELVIYAVSPVSLDKETIKTIMQKKINQELNPLFKISDLIFLKELPRTASNKVMRRVLRKNYLTRNSGGL